MIGDEEELGREQLGGRSLEDRAGKGTVVLFAGTIRLEVRPESVEKKIVSRLGGGAKVPWTPGTSRSSDEEVCERLLSQNQEVRCNCKHSVCLSQRGRLEECG